LKLGLTQAQLNKIFIDNPARTLALDVNTSDKSRGIS
jgi:predicted metal-dependent phosphotriesterase family hydrolase